MKYKHIPSLIFLGIQKEAKDLNAEVPHKGSGVGWSLREKINSSTSNEVTIILLLKSWITTKLLSVPSENFKCLNKFSSFLQGRILSPPKKPYFLFKGKMQTLTPKVWYFLW